MGQGEWRFQLFPFYAWKDGEYMTDYLLKGVLIGLLFGLPVGAVGTMTVQRTWNFGFRSGLLTGLGSSAADCFYAIVGAFGLTLISDFLFQYQTIINLFGSGLILFMGIRLILKKDAAIAAKIKATGGLKMFLSSFAIGITNPAAILTFLFAFSYFGISGMTEPIEGAALVCGVFVGTYIWWTALSAATCGIRRRTEKNHSLKTMNQVFGILFILFAVSIALNTFI